MRLPVCELASAVCTLCKRFRVPGFPERYPAGTQPGANSFVVGCNDTLADDFASASATIC